MTQEKNQGSHETNLPGATFSLINSRRRISWELLATGVLGGILGTAFVNTVLYLKQNPHRFWQETVLNKSPLDKFFSNDWPSMGSVDREAILHDHAQVIAGANVSDEDLEDKLFSFLARYDEVLQNLMVEKKVLLLERNAFAAHTVPDFTEEVKRRLHQTEDQKTKAQP